MSSPAPLTYAGAGVVRGDTVLGGLIDWVARTKAFRAGGVGEDLLPVNYYASVLRLTDDLALAICTDGVGSKILIAEQMGRYDTLGIDCIAMNANDLVCVGAEPMALVDYVGVDVADHDVLEQIGKGLHEGARQANISIPGGELAQLPGMITGAGEGPAVDLVGTCVGVVHPDKLNYGQNVAPGDVVIGLHSSGIHSNGLTLARRALFERGDCSLDDAVPGTDATVGEALLRPTRIYVRPILELLRSGIDIHALCHMTGEGLFNLNRVAQPVSFELDALPEPQPIFQLIQAKGGIEDAEMYQVFNMGVGFCVVVPKQEVEPAIDLLRGAGEDPLVLGRVVEGADRTIALPALDLLGRAGEFAAA